MKADLAARGNTPITGDLVTLGPGIWCEDTPSSGALSPQGVVRFDGREDRFDQAVGQGWFVLVLGGAATDVPNAPHRDMLRRLGGRVLSVGPEGSGCDVVTLDDTYRDWSAGTGARYAVIRPDFYVAATAETPDGLADCLGRIGQRLGIVAAQEDPASERGRDT